MSKDVNDALSCSRDKDQDCFDQPISSSPKSKSPQNPKPNQTFERVECHKVERWHEIHEKSTFPGGISDETKPKIPNWLLVFLKAAGRVIKKWLFKFFQ